VKNIYESFIRKMMKASWHRNYVPVTLRIENKLKTAMLRRNGNGKSP